MMRTVTVLFFLIIISGLDDILFIEGAGIWKIFVRDAEQN